MSHPLRPVGRLNEAARGPGAGNVVVGIPFQGPQFFDSDLSGGPIHKEDVYKSVVAVDGEDAHFVTGSANSCTRLSIVLWRVVGLVRLAVSAPGAVGHNRDVIQAFMIGVSPVLLEPAAITGIVAVINPLVQ